MPTLKGRVLLGWYSRDAAVNFLLNECVFDPPIDAAMAEAIWRPYRDLVEALPDRVWTVLPNLGLTLAEVAHAIKFRKFLASTGDQQIGDVQKIDLSALAVIQHMVVTERSDSYINAVTKPGGWLEECLPLASRNSQVQFTVRRTALQTTQTEILLPHAEFLFAADPQGHFVASEWMRHVTATRGVDRTFLTAGYHRSFARVLTTPTAMVPSAVVAVAVNTLVSPTMPMVAPGVAMGVVDPLCPWGTKAARLKDFFTDGLFMDVDLRKRRYVLQVNATVLAVDDLT